MKFWALLFILVFSISLAHSGENPQKLYLNQNAIQAFDAGFCFEHNQELYFIRSFEVDSTGIYVSGPHFFRMWYCNNCHMWISNDCEICPRCGKEK